MQLPMPNFVTERVPVAALQPRPVLGIEALVDEHFPAVDPQRPEDVRFIPDQRDTEPIV